MPRKTKDGPLAQAVKQLQAARSVLTDEWKNKRSQIDAVRELIDDALVAVCVAAEKERLLTSLRTTDERKCGPVVLNNDGMEWLCMGCGAKLSRSRDNLYGEPKHRGKPRWNKEYDDLCMEIIAKERRP